MKHYAAALFRHRANPGSKARLHLCYHTFQQLIDRPSQTISLQAEYEIQLPSRSNHHLGHLANEFHKR